MGLVMLELDSCSNLKEELGKHRGRNGRTECVLGGNECF